MKKVWLIYGLVMGLMVGVQIAGPCRGDESTTIGSTADALMFGGAGGPAAFAALARAVRHLASADGGVDVLGHRWESDEPLPPPRWPEPPRVECSRCGHVTVCRNSLSAPAVPEGERWCTACVREVAA